MLNRAFGFVAAIAVGLGAVQAASAADLPAKALLSPAPAYSWTGFYVGGFAGAGWGTNEVTLASATGPGLPAIPFANLNLPFGQISRSGALGGGQAGYNYQTGWIVVGVEGDIAGTGIKGTAPCGTFIATFFSCTASDNWLATVSARVGGVVGERTLVYVKGGGAWLNSKFTGSVPAIVAGTALQSGATNTATGWLLGFGVEYAFAAHWSGFIEYNYMDFGTNNVNFNSFPGGFLPTGSVATMAITTKLSVAKAGVNYRF
jgi:outer membrane immunogenic protein